jgi:molybdate transport system substrate-binding protein
VTGKEKAVLRRPFALVSSATVALLVAACGGSGSQSSASPPAGQVTGNLTVLAAASLTDAFNKMGEQFKAQHSGADVKFSYAGSPTLVTQIQQGAPADVFASADQANMQKVVDGGLNSKQPKVFARNKLEIVVQAGNPKQIKSVADLANPAIRVDVCAPGVPCGTYATSVFSNANAKITPVSQEDNVKAVVTKVSLGEADAGIVYATDVKAGGDKVQGVTIPDDQNVMASYPIVQLKAATNEKAAQAFITLVTGSEGQKTLAGYGFLSPS